MKNKLNKTMLAYLAGAIDSDGYITIKRSTYYLRKFNKVSNPSYMETTGIKQVQPQIIDIIHKNFGGYRKVDKPNTKNGKPLVGVQLTCKKAVAFIEAIYPYLILKKRQADIILELREKYTNNKNGSVIVDAKCRWGQIVKVTRKIHSKEQVDYAEGLRNKIRLLNDARYDESHKSIRANTRFDNITY